LQRGKVTTAVKAVNIPRTTRRDYLLLDTHSENPRKYGILSEETKYVKGIIRMQQY
jgi:hypothetical protein